MEECEWIKEYDHLKINGIDYYFRCSWCCGKKAPNKDNPSIQLVFTIWNDTDKCFIDWNEFRGSYLAEKLNDYVKNTINGQRRVYYSNDYERDFSFVNKIKDSK